MDNSSFYVLLASNASTDVYKGNSLSSFTNVLPSPLKIDSSWRVALQALSFDTRFSDVPLDVKDETHAVFIWKLETAKKRSLSHNRLPGVLPKSENQSSEDPTDGVKITLTFTSWEVEGEDQDHLVSEDHLISETDGDTKEKKFNFNDFRSQPRFVLNIPHDVDDLKHVGYILQEQVPHEICRFDVRNRNIIINLNENYLIGIRSTLAHFLNLEKGSHARIYELYKTGDRKKFYIYVGDNYLKSSKQVKSLEPPKKINAILEQMKWSISGGSYHKILATIPFDWNPKNPSFYHEVERREYYDLLNIPRRLTIRLLDEKNRPLNLLSGQSTFLKLKFAKMSDTSMFSMRVTSHDSIKMYNANTASDFRLNLVHPIELSYGQWEVALSSIHYPSDFDILDFVEDDIWFHIYSRERDLGVISFSKNDVEMRQIVQSRDKLVNFINENMKKMGGTVKIHLKRMYMMAGDDHEIVVAFSRGLAKIVGSVEAWSTTDSKIVYNLHPKRGHMFPRLVLDVAQMLPHSFLLYSDIIRPINVGASYDRVLKLIPKPSNKLTYYECKHLDFIPITENRLSHMHFELRLHDGRNVPFNNLSEIVIINLLFRRK